MSKKRKTARHLTKKRTKRKRTAVKGVGNKQSLKIKLSVSDDDWGDIQPNEIAILLQDTAFHINRLLRSPFDEKIRVVPSQVDHPKVLYRESPEDPHTIWISARDNDWCKFAYQFAHEFCHVLSGHENLKENPNNWFHEAICELSSMFTIRRMSVRWLTHPAFPNQKVYAASLREYGQNLLNNQDAQLPANMSLYGWLSSYENELRQIPVDEKEQRNNQVLVASHLLPIFEKTPNGWNAIRKLPSCQGRFSDYLVSWYSTVDSEDQASVTRLSDAFGYTIPLDGN